MIPINYLSMHLPRTVLRKTSIPHLMSFSTLGSQHKPDRAHFPKRRNTEPAACPPSECLGHVAKRGCHSSSAAWQRFHVVACAKPSRLFALRGVFKRVIKSQQK